MKINSRLKYCSFLSILQNDKHEIVDTLITLEPENNFSVRLQKRNSIIYT